MTGKTWAEPRNFIDRILNVKQPLPGSRLPGMTFPTGQSRDFILTDTVTRVLLPDRVINQEKIMIPVVDYGSVAIVVPSVTAVGGIVETDDNFGFEVYLAGSADPIVVGFNNQVEAESARAELIEIIARYYFTRELGPDFEEEIMDSFDEDDDDDGEKKEH